MTTGRINQGSHKMLSRAARHDGTSANGLLSRPHGVFSLDRLAPNSPCNSYHCAIVPPSTSVGAVSGPAVVCWFQCTGEQSRNLGTGPPESPHVAHGLKRGRERTTGTPEKKIRKTIDSHPTVQPKGIEVTTGSASESIRRKKTQTGLSSKKERKEPERAEGI